jgi:hypothetical protein
MSRIFLGRHGVGFVTGGQIRLHKWHYCGNYMFYVRPISGTSTYGIRINTWEMRTFAFNSIVSISEKGIICERQIDNEYHQVLLQFGIPASQFVPFGTKDAAKIYASYLNGDVFSIAHDKGYILRSPDHRYPLIIQNKRKLFPGELKRALDWHLGDIGPTCYLLANQ